MAEESSIYRRWLGRLWGYRQIINSLGNAMPERAKIVFEGLIVADDPASAATKVSLPEINALQHGNLGGGSLHALATNGSNGFMSAADKAKLNSMDPSAYVVSVGRVAPIQINNSNPQTPVISIDPATGSLPGSMSASDKAKLDASTAAATAGTIVQRDGSAGASFGEVGATSVRSATNTLVIGANGFSDMTLDGPTNTLIVPGAGIKSTFKLQNALSVSRAVPMHWKAYLVAGAQSWIPTISNDARQNVLDAESELYCDMYLPHGTTINYLALKIKGGGTIGQTVPANPPVYTLVRKNMNTGAQQIIATMNDPLGAGYRATPRWNSLDCSLLAVANADTRNVIDSTVWRYYLKITGEYGTDAQLGMELQGIQAQITYPAGYELGTF